MKAIQNKFMTGVVNQPGHLGIITNNDNQILKGNQPLDLVEFSSDTTKVSQGDDNRLHNEYELYNIFTWNNFKICLICNIVLNSSSISIEFVQDTKSHLNSSEHKTNLTSFFKLCFGDCIFPSDEKHKYVINNSYIDLYSPGQNTSFLFIKRNYIFCMSCKNDIALISETEEALIDSITNHLRDKIHIRNLQDNVNWACNLPSQTGCLKFYKTLFYCSICNESINCKEHLLIESAVCHLETSHNFDFNKDKCDGNIGEIEIGYNLSSSASNINNDPSNKTNTDTNNDSDIWFDAESNVDTSEGEKSEVDKNLFLSPAEKDIFCLYDFVDSSTKNPQINLRNLDSSNFLPCNKCDNNIEKTNDDFEIFVESHFQKQEINLAVSKHFAGGEEDISNMYFCSQCEESIELLNDDFEFSLQIHSQKHKEKDDCMEVMISQCNFKENFDYVCPDCNEVVKIFNRDIEFSFHQHYQEFHKNVEKLITAQERVVANVNFFSDIFDCLPQALQKHRPFIVMELDSMYCTLCNCSIEITKNVFETSNILNNHLLVKFHTTQYNVVSEMAKTNCMDRKLSSKSSFAFFAQKVEKCSDVQDQNNLANICTLGESLKYGNDKPEICQSVNQNLTRNTIAENISNYVTPSTDVTENNNSLSIINKFSSDLKERLKIHKEFLTVTQDITSCRLCSFDINTNENDVMKHISDISHRIHFFTELKKHLDICHRSDVKYLVFISGKLYCNLCNSYITSSGSIWEVVRNHFVDVAHLSSVFHNLQSVDKKAESRTCNPKTVDQNDIKVFKNVSDNVNISPKDFDSNNVHSNLKDTVVCKKSAVTIISNATCGINREAIEVFKFDSINESPTESVNTKTLMKDLKLESIEKSTPESINKQTLMQDLELETIKESPPDSVITKTLMDDVLLVTIEESQDVSVNTKTFIKDLKLETKKESQPVFVDTKTLKQNIKLEAVKESQPVSVNTKMLINYVDLEKLKGSVPMLKVNLKFIRRWNENFYCVLCNKGISYSPNRIKLSTNFNTHLNSVMHKTIQKKQNIVSGVQTNYTLNNGHSRLAKSLPLQNENSPVSVNKEMLINDVELEKLKGSVPMLEVNLKFIRRWDANFHCVLCNKGISYSPNRIKLSTNFNTHFNSVIHKTIQNIKIL